MTIQELAKKMQENYPLTVEEVTEFNEGSCNVQLASFRYSTELGNLFIRVKQVSSCMTIKTTVVISSRDTHLIGTSDADVTKTVHVSNLDSAYAFIESEVDKFLSNLSLWDGCGGLVENLDGSRKILLATLDTDEDDRFQALNIGIKGDLYTLDDMLEVSAQVFIDVCKTLAKSGKMTTMTEIQDYLKRHWLDSNLKQSCKDSL